MTETRSPLKEKPLRVPGQSIQDQINDVVDEKVLGYALAIAFFPMLALFEWVRWWAPLPPAPWFVTIVSAIAVLYSVWKLSAMVKLLRALKLGRDGERIVAEMLNQLRSSGAIIFHDIQGPTFNVDHLVLSRRGFFVVETKTRSKRSGAQVVFDGKELRVDGRKPDRDPIAQVRALKDWVTSTLKASTGKSYSVKPVVVFPGWFVNPVKEQGNSDVWVLNPEALPVFIRNEPEVVTEEDFRLAVYHMATIARASA